MPIDDAIPQVTPDTAHATLTRDPTALLLDVRSRVEFDYVGHPPGALHVALKEFPDWEVDPDFTGKAASVLTEAAGADDARRVPVFVMCRSGARSLAAARLLKAVGFENVANVAEGFEGDKDEAGHRNTVNGWRARGLPWEQT